MRERAVVRELLADTGLVGDPGLPLPSGCGLCVLPPVWWVISSPKEKKKPKSFCRVSMLETMSHVYQTPQLIRDKVLQYVTSFRVTDKAFEEEYHITSTN